MSETPEIDRNSTVILARTGRLPSWHGLSEADRKAFEQEHVDLMLSVAKEHKMTRLEGYRLINVQQDWVRFWVIEFPTMVGAEAWIEAEMAPPFGLYGYYAYHLARRRLQDYLNTWVTRPSPSRALQEMMAYQPYLSFPGQPSFPVPSSDPHHIPPLQADRNSVVILVFARWRAGAEGLSPEARGDAEHNALMQALAREHGLMRLECYQLIGRQDAWHRAWIIEFPTLEGAEAWMEGELQLPHGQFTQKRFHLARKWAHDYFATWVAR